MEEVFNFLYVEDDVEMIQLVKKILEPIGKIDAVSTIREALELLDQKDYNLILIDLMLKAETGFDFIQELKLRDFAFQPRLIVLTSSTDEEDEVRSHDMAIDEFIQKPFRHRAFTAQMRKYVAEFKNRNDNRKKAGILKINLTKQEVSINTNEIEEVIRLTHKEYRLLMTFINNPMKNITREQLLTEVWEAQSTLNSRTVDMHVSGLKKKLGEAGQYISSVRGVGYMFNHEEEYR